MLTTRSATKVVSGHQKVTFRYFLRKAWINSFHCMFCKFFVVMYLQIWTWNNHIRINIVVVVFVNPSSDAAAITASVVQFLTSLGSVIFPVTAEAATTTGDAR